MNISKTIAQILILFLLIYSISYLNTEITTNATRATATTFDVFAGNVFPIFLSILPLVYGGYVLYDVMKEML